MKNNKYVQVIPQDILTQSQTKINEATTLIAPYARDFIIEERHELTKMGEKTIGFVEKIYDFAKQNPNLLPPYLDMNAFGTDFKILMGFGRWLTASTTLTKTRIGDKEMTAENEAYQVRPLLQVDQNGGSAGHIRCKDGLLETKTHFPCGKRKNGKTETVVKIVPHSLKKPKLGLKDLILALRERTSAL